MSEALSEIIIRDKVFRLALVLTRGDAEDVAMAKCKFARAIIAAADLDKQLYDRMNSRVGIAQSIILQRHKPAYARLMAEFEADD
jgi:hypothetical protein